VFVLPELTNALYRFDQLTNRGIQVDKRTKVPLWSITVTTIISCFLALINIGSAVAFNDIISLSVSGLYTSYLICAVLLLYRRLTNGFISTIDPDSSSTPELANTAGAPLVWGPWHIPGLFGILNNIFACIYLTIILFFCFWPPGTPVSASTMNYAVVVTGSVIIFSLVYYSFWARHEWQGPVIEARL